LTFYERNPEFPLIPGNY